MEQIYAHFQMPEIIWQILTLLKKLLKDIKQQENFN